MAKSIRVGQTGRLMAIVIVLTGLSCTPQSSTPAPKPAATGGTAPVAMPADPIVAEVINPDLPMAAIAAGSKGEEPATPEQPVTIPEVAIEAVPLDLTKHYQMRSENFEKVTMYAWKIVPHGKQTFANIPLELGGAMFLWGERNAANGQKYPESHKDIAVNQTFETLYIYHSAFYEGKAGDTVYDIVFHYDDGTSATDHIVNGADLRDWYFKKDQPPVGPTGPRSTLAWSGADENGNWVRYCLTAVENPYPSVVVKSLDLVSAKTQTAGCILGITVGKSGLMIKTKDDLPPTNPTE